MRHFHEFLTLYSFPTRLLIQVLMLRRLERGGTRLKMQSLSCNKNLNFSSNGSEQKCQKSYSISHLTFFESGTLLALTGGLAIPHGLNAIIWKEQIFSEMWRKFGNSEEIRINLLYKVHAFRPSLPHLFWILQWKKWARERKRARRLKKETANVLPCGPSLSSTNLVLSSFLRLSIDSKMWMSKNLPFFWLDILKYQDRKIQGPIVSGHVLISWNGTS